VWSCCLPGLAAGPRPGPSADRGRAALPCFRMVAGMFVSANVDFLGKKQIGIFGPPVSSTQGSIGRIAWPSRVRKDDTSLTSEGDPAAESNWDVDEPNEAREAVGGRPDTLGTKKKGRATKAPPRARPKMERWCEAPVGTALLGSRGPELALRLAREDPLFRHFMYCQLRAPPPPSCRRQWPNPLAFSQKDRLGFPSGSMTTEGELDDIPRPTARPGRNGRRGSVGTVVDCQETSSASFP
jgi:hypothetical protein